MWVALSDAGIDEKCFELFGCSNDMLRCYHGYCNARNVKSTYQFIDDQTGHVGNVPKGDNLCSSEPKWVWTRVDFYDTYIYEKCLKIFSCSKNMLRCYHGCCNARNENNTSQLIQYECWSVEIWVEDGTLWYSKDMDDFVPWN